MALPANGPHFTPLLVRGLVGGGGEGKSHGRVKREGLGRGLAADPREAEALGGWPPACAANPTPRGLADSFCCDDGRRPSTKSTAPWEKSGGCLVGTDLAGEGGALRRLALDRRSGGREDRAVREADQAPARWPDTAARRAVFDQRSESRPPLLPPRRGSEAGRPISALKIGLERRFETVRFVYG
jgi:hypothetical protein